MKLTTVTALLTSAAVSQGSLIITGIIDGDLTNGLPKATILTATADIADLSTFGYGSATNGGGSDGQELTFSGSISLGQTILVTNSSASSDFFTSNFLDSFTIFEGSAAGNNGDDAIEVFSGGLVIDLYGDINTIGDGESWDYTDGYAVRTGGSASATFTQGNYISVFRGLAGQDEAAHAATIATVYGFTPIPEPSSVLLGGLGLLALLSRRR